MKEHALASLCKGHPPRAPHELHPSLTRHIAVSIDDKHNCMIRLLTRRAMSSAYYLAKPPGSPFSGRPKMASSIPLNEIPTLSLLYKLKKIEPSADVDSSYEPSGAYNDRISVIRQDITTLAVDCIVNAANTSLLGGGGVDGAIHAAAGPELLDECGTLGGCETGSAKITDGYDLPADKIIHAVGPIYWNKNKDEAARLLTDCYKASLQLAVDNDCRSIAFSALSTGVYGYPSGEASLVALETVRKFLEEEEKAEKLDRVIFCNFLQKDEDAYFKNIPCVKFDSQNLPSLIYGQHVLSSCDQQHRRCQNRNRDEGRRRFGLRHRGRTGYRSDH